MGTCVASYQINANIVVILSRITTTLKNVVIDYSKSDLLRSCDDNLSVR